MGVLHEVARRGDQCAVEYLQRELVAGKQLDKIDERDLGNKEASLALVKKGANLNALTKVGFQSIISMVQQVMSISPVLM
eukprot:1188401-Prorocentrum_minimum.AAC.6